MSEMCQHFVDPKEGWLTIEYYGMKLEVPPKFKYIATDKGGDIYAYTHNPCLEDDYFHIGDDHPDEGQLLINGDITGRGISMRIEDFADSIRKIENLVIVPIIETDLKTLQPKERFEMLIKNHHTMATYGSHNDMISVFINDTTTFSCDTFNVHQCLVSPYSISSYMSECLRVYALHEMQPSKKFTDYSISLVLLMLYQAFSDGRDIFYINEDSRNMITTWDRLWEVYASGEGELLITSPDPSHQIYIEMETHWARYDTP